LVFGRLLVSEYVAGVETASGAEGAGAEDPGVPAASGEPADATATVPEKICLDVGAGVDDATPPPPLAIGLNDAGGCCASTQDSMPGAEVGG
jgi:hypothetical protein